MVARALLPIGLAIRSSIVLPAVCTTRLVARALRLWRPTRRSIVCCQQCAACFVARALLLCVLATRRSIAVCQQCAALCQRAFFAPLHNWCVNCWAAVMRHTIRLLARCFNAALRACTHAFIPPCEVQRRAKPDTKWPRCGLMNVFMQPSRAAFFAGRVISEGRRHLVKIADHVQFIAFFYAQTQ